MMGLLLFVLIASPLTSPRSRNLPYNRHSRFSLLDLAGRGCRE